MCTIKTSLVQAQDRGEQAGGTIIGGGRSGGLSVNFSRPKVSYEPKNSALKS